MNSSLEQADAPTVGDMNFGMVIAQATLGLTEAANSLAALSTNKERSQKATTIRRGLNRHEAAQYIGVGATKFDQLVQNKEMPRPKKIGGRSVWDIVELDSAFDEIGNPANSALGLNAWD